jgi:MerR family transcriptional regulator, redox-sensitive transcriptional activator SoxR
MKEFTIGQVAQYAGVQTSAIRYYESVGLLPLPKRLNGHRRYDLTVLKRLGLIQLLRQAGFGIRELQVLFSGLNMDAPTSPQWQTLAVEKIAEMDALIKQTQATKAWLVEALQRECKGVDDCITISFDETGSGMRVTLACDASQSNKTPDTRKSMKLMTMSPHNSIRQNG